MFTIIGERINTSRKNVQKAAADRDLEYIQNDVKRQAECGATYIDVNAGARIGHEKEDLTWLIETIQAAVDLPLCLDSPDPSALEMAYTLVTRRPIINSISLEKVRYEAMVPFLKGKDVGIIALCMDDTGMPKSAEDVIQRAGRLVESLESIGMKREQIYIDPLIQPVATETGNGMMAINAVRGIVEKYPGVHTACGLSNISFGLPLRKLINRTFLSLLMSAGLDSAILDPLDKKIMAILRTSLMLLGQDDYCGDFLDGVREKDIKD